MKNFDNSYLGVIVAMGLVLIGFCLLCLFVSNDHAERMSIIYNTKENVVKYKNCEEIDSYFYCWEDKNE